MGVTQHRTKPYREVIGADGEKIFAWGSQVKWSDVHLATAGTNTVDMYTVPAGQIFVAQSYYALNQSHACTFIFEIMQDGSNSYYLTTGVNVAQNVPLIWNGNVVFTPGQIARVYFGGCVLNDSIVTSLLGYAMTIP